MVYDSCYLVMEVGEVGVDYVVFGVFYLIMIKIVEY